MSEPTGIEIMSCRQMRRSFAALAERPDGRETAAPLAAAERHLKDCPRCAREYRLFALGRAALELSGSPEPVRPDESFFVALRAQIARGPAEAAAPTADESWAAAVFLTARQLIPAMAVLLLLILGATLLPKSAPAGVNTAEIRPRERVLFNQLYDYPEPTPDDVLETLVAVEEKENGK